MKSIVGILLSAFALCSPCAHAAAPTPVELLSGIPHQALFGVAFDGLQGVAVGAGGEVADTSDGGKTWRVTRAPSPASLLGVAIRGTRRIAVGQMGLILIKEGDKAWIPVASGTEERLMAVSLNAQGAAVIVGSFGTVLVSGDHGATWRNGSPAWGLFFDANAVELGDGFKPHLYSVVVDDRNRMTAVGEVGVVMRSDDCSGSWQIIRRGDSEGGTGHASLFALDVEPDGIGYAVGQSGLMMRTADGGATWEVVKTGSTANLLGVAVSAKRNVTVTAMREVLTSRDSGATWQSIQTLDVKTGWYNSVVAPDDSGDVIAVGHSGRIIRIGN